MPTKYLYLETLSSYISNNLGSLDCIWDSLRFRGLLMLPSVSLRRMNMFSFNQCLLITYLAPGALPGAGNTTGRHVRLCSLHHTVPGVRPHLVCVSINGPTPGWGRAPPAQPPRALRLLSAHVTPPHYVSGNLDSCNDEKARSMMRCLSKERIEQVRNHAGPPWLD